MNAQRTPGRARPWAAVLGLGLALASAFASAFAIPVHAADWDDGCCVDLEERLIELETSAARKGNRSVSLTVSGWINQAVFAWDDGVESNAYGHEFS